MGKFLRHHTKYLAAAFNFSHSFYQKAFLWENFPVDIQNTSLQPVFFPTDFIKISFLWEKLPVRQNPHYLKNLLIVKKCFIYYIVGT